MSAYLMVVLKLQKIMNKTAHDLVFTSLQRCDNENLWETMLQAHLFYLTFHSLIVCDMFFFNLSNIDKQICEVLRAA